MQMETENPCSKCMAGCCRKYSVCLTGYDVARLAKATDNLDWIDSIYAEDTDSGIARSFSLYEDSRIEKYILCLRMTDEENCIFLGKDNLCKVYEARPMICRIYPFNQRISDKLNYKENIRCPVKWDIRGKEAEKFLGNIVRNKKELEEYGKLCEEWDSELTPEKTLSDFIDFIIAKVNI